MIIDFRLNHRHTVNAQSINIGDQVLDRVESAKILGVTISSDLTWSTHVDNIISKASKRLCMLFQLKRAVLEFACPVWSTSIPQYLTDSIEMVQKRALRAIYPGLHYDDILLLLAIPSLKERRENICKLYFDRLTCTEHKLHHLLPVERGVTYDLRNQNTYPLPLTRTDRLTNYLIPYG